MSKSERSINKDVPPQFNLQLAEWGGFLFDYHSGFIYLLNHPGCELLLDLWSGEPKEPVIKRTGSHPREPLIKRHAIINTLSVTGGKLGRGIFPFDRREEEVLREDSTRRKNAISNSEPEQLKKMDQLGEEGGDIQAFLNKLIEYGIVG